MHKYNQELKFVFGQVENILRIGEYAGYQHFLFFPQCFQKASFPGLCGKQLNFSTPFFDTLHYHEPHLICFLSLLSAVSLLKTLGKGDIAQNEKLLFLQCFLPIWRTF